MSRALPEGSTVIATVFRPTVSSPGLGIMRARTTSPIEPLWMASAIADKLPLLFDDARLPMLVLGGPPLTILLQVILPNGDLRAFAASANIDRAVSRSDLLEATANDMPRIVAALFALLDEAGDIVSHDVPASRAMH